MLFCEPCGLLIRKCVLALDDLGMLAGSVPTVFPVGPISIAAITAFSEVETRVSRLKVTNGLELALGRIVDVLLEGIWHIVMIDTRLW